ncbi:hypothetical protein Celaphus_00016870 [Cervus elaphus hippelaphus]|uniref:Uncharacterized protein n=1 Tax=Cervus elaphus hippelaphus TaxID=46360 RepID=A0A212CMY0_CEREH|nr:hypothetical protein Celaphus_00016870 [Cervus elaphus hippelaphus]
MRAAHSRGAGVSRGHSQQPQGRADHVTHTVLALSRNVLEIRRGRGERARSPTPELQLHSSPPGLVQPLLSPSEEVCTGGGGADTGLCVQWGVLRQVRGRDGRGRQEHQPNTSRENEGHLRLTQGGDPSPQSVRSLWADSCDPPALHSVFL